MLNEMSVMRSPYSREIRPSHKTLLLKSRNNTARSYCTHPTHQSPPYVQCNRRPRPTGRGEDDLGALELRACRDSLKPRTQCSPRRKETEREERKEGGIKGRRIERDRGTKSGSFPRKLLRTALLLAQAHFPSRVPPWDRRVWRVRSRNFF